MRNIIFIIAFTSLLFSCSSDSNNSSSNNGNNNGNSFTNSMDYEFTITINGVVHKVKGNSRDGIPSGTFGIGNISNKCLSINNSSFGASVQLGINDVTTPNYISGQNLECLIQFPNLLLGSNQATVYFQGGYFQTLAASLGTSSFYFQTVSGSLNSAIFNKLPINITDLGTTSANYLGIGGSGFNQYVFGQTLKGNYSGTIYLPNSTNNQYTIPVQLSIDFKVLRQY
jgi:hypothetical protein